MAHPETTQPGMVIPGKFKARPERSDRPVRLVPKDAGDGTGEAVVARSEARYRMMFETSLDPMVMGTIDGRILEANAAARQAFGWGSEDVGNIHRSEIIVDDESSREAIAILERDGAYRGEICMRGRGGSIMVVEMRAVRFRGPDGEPMTSVALRDLSGQRAAETESRLAASALEFAQQPVVVLDDDFSVRSVNQSFTRITGLAYEDVAMLMPNFLCDSIGLPLLPGEPAGALRETLHWYGPASCRRSDGTRFPLSLSITSVASSSSGESSYMVVFTQVPDDEDEQRRLDFLASHDELTGLANRRSFIERAEDVFAEAYREGSEVGVLVLDLDHFKSFNHSMGNAQGDAVIKTFAQRIKDALSESEFIARLDGDEFAVLTRGRTSPDDMDALGSRILDLASRPFQIGQQQVHLSCSVGGACFPRDGSDLDQIMGHASRAVREAKDMGRNLLRMHNRVEGVMPSDDFMLTNALRHAIEKDELSLVMQPLVNLEDGSVKGCEALVRWDHPRLGSVSPKRFIPLAEESGLIGLVGAWVLRKACTYAAAWGGMGLQDAYVSVNLSTRQLRDPGLVKQVAQILAETGVPASRLVLEVTESAMMKDIEQTRKSLDGLSALGCRIAIDDFGTGYSSLSYLRDLPVDIVKIDQSFVAGVPGSPHDITIVRTVIGMAQALDLTVIAEGVETAAQYEYLRKQGCDLAQGYFMSRPRPASGVHSFIRSGFRRGPVALEL